ncbi:MAG: hypothetical protein ABL958_00125 [Bdellovibrionia bacterium]
MALRFFSIAFLSLALLSCANLFSELSEKDSDKAKLYDAKRLLDQSQWSDAITKLNSLSSTYAVRRDVRALLASAYAGRCGIDMLNLINAITNASPSEKIFVTLLKTMTDATLTSIDDCALAESTINAIGVTGDRTVDENLLMTFVEFGKIGAILNLRGDLDDDNNFDSAAGDAGFDPCDNADIPRLDAVGDQASASQLVASFAILITSLQASGSTIAQTELGELTAICAQGGGANDICNVTDASAVTDDQRKTIRAIVTANEVGLSIINADTATVLLGCAGT